MNDDNPPSAEVPKVAPEPPNVPNVAALLKTLDRLLAKRREKAQHEKEAA